MSDLRRDKGSLRIGGRVSLLLKEPKEQAWWTPLWRAYEMRVQLLAERDRDEVVVL
jgi:hypothetical protein